MRTICWPRGRTDHPGYAETIANHEADWRKVVAEATGPPPEGKRIYYQKHMAHHVLPGMSVEWIDRLTNCFLIRQPRETLLSMNEFLPSLSVGETGLPQQVEMFERIAERDGAAPPVVDSRDVLADPRGMLSALCSRLAIPFYRGNARVAARAARYRRRMGAILVRESV